MNMDGVYHIRMLFMFLLLGNGILYSRPQFVEDTTHYQVLEETHLAEISTECDRIRQNFNFVQQRWLDEVLVFASNIAANDFSYTEKSSYLRRLRAFLASIQHPYQDVYFSSNTYDEALKLLPGIMMHSKEGLGFQYLHHQFFVQQRFQLFYCYPFFSDDPNADQLIVNAAKRWPDVFLRNVEIFDTTRVFSEIMEALLLEAPMNVKRYLNSTNRVKRYLEANPTVYSRTMFDIHRICGPNSRAFIFIDQIVEGHLTIDEAEVLSDKAPEMFRYLVQGLRSGKLQQLSFNHHQWLSSHAGNVLRRLNTGSDTQPLAAYELETLLALICYGHRQSTASVFRKVIKLMHFKSQEVAPDFVQRLDEAKMGSLVASLDQLMLLEQFLKCFGAYDRNLLLELLGTNQSGHIFEAHYHYFDLPREKSDRSGEGNVRTSPGKEVRMKLMLTRDLAASLDQISSFKHEPYAREVLLEAAANIPDEVLKRFHQIYRLPFGQAVIECAVMNAPVSAKRYGFHLANEVRRAAERSDHPAVRKTFELFDSVGYLSNAYLLLDDLVKRHGSIAEAHTLAQSQERLVASLVRIISNESYYAGYSIDQYFRHYALRYVRGMNDLLDGDQVVRFEAARALPIEQLYFIMVYGEEEVLKSTFDGLFPIFCDKLNGLAPNQFFNSISYNRYSTFFALCANYGYASHLVDLTHSSVQKLELIDALLDPLTSETNVLAESSRLAEILYSLQTDSLRDLLENRIDERSVDCRTNGFETGYILSRILLHLDADSSGDATVGAVATMRTADLAGADGKILQQYYFYDDEDGARSFVNFLDRYRSSSDWKIEDHGNYIRIVSASGVNIQLLANKPEHGRHGVADIHDYFGDNTPSVVVHRGHSYHTDKTIAGMAPNAELIFLGSCGGYYKIKAAMVKAPVAHYIATRQIGTMEINDPVLFAMNEKLREGEDIYWPSFWKSLEDHLGQNPLFEDYVPPHKHIGIRFIRSFYDAIGLQYKP